MADGQPGRPAPPTESTVSGADWYADDITGMTATRVAYVDVDMTETTSTGSAVFDECTFRTVRFNVSAHVDAAFANCTFSGCTFFGASFQGCKFVGSRFERCTFERLVVVGGDWSFVGLPGADLRTAELTGVRMREADLTAARCDGATLRGLDLAGAALGRASFDRCDLRGSDISGIDPWSTSLVGAIVDWQQAIALTTALGLDVRPD
jgi:uncharacterized protein YjbI with pentapeptide repeats